MRTSDLRPEIRWLSSGFLLMLCSGFGQTYFIAIFAGHLKRELMMTDGEFGSLFTAGTLASAVVFMWAGKLADRLTVRWLGVIVLVGLAFAALAMAALPAAWMLVFVLFGLRFFGQGMSTHVAMTAMARWFHRKRGRAVSIAALGLPAGEGLLPPLAVAGIGLVGWRRTWIAAATLLFVLAVPVLIALLKRERAPSAGLAVPDATHEENVRREWTRGEVLRTPLFYVLMAIALGPPFIVTGLFFNQVTIVEMKAWELSWFAANFPILAGFHVVSALGAGWMVDRVGARRLLPAILVPLGLTALMLTYAESPYVVPAVMALVGTAQGGASSLHGALWAELYGTAHLGAIRSLVMAGVVLASALSPALMGVLMDAGITLEVQLPVMAVYCALGTLGAAWLTPRLDRLAIPDQRPQSGRSVVRRQ